MTVPGTGPGAGPESLRVAFLGSPGFAVPILEALVRSRHRVVLVVTQPDRPSGRGLRPRPTPVRVAAEQLALPVETVPAEDRKGLADLLEGLRPDVTVTAAWAGLVNRRGLAASRIASLNVHPSMLPRYRGAAPVERALMAGETSFGVTVMHLAPSLDAGDIVLQEDVVIPPGATAGEVRELLAGAGGSLLVRAVDLLACGGAPRMPQDELGVTWAPKLTPEDERVSWRMPAREIVDRVRALSPDPGAHFVCRGRRVKIVKARIGSAVAAEGRRPGTLFGREGDALSVIAGDGVTVVLVRVKPAGGREISGADFANGLRLGAGDTIAAEGG